MNFFQQQDHRRRQTLLLVSLLALTVLLLSVAIYILFVILLSFQSTKQHGRFDPFQFKYFFYCISGTLLLVASGSLYMWIILSKGAGVMVERLGGSKVDFDTKDPQEKQLRNVVEEMSIAALIPIPRIYLLKEERGINAFAAGLTLNDSVIAVTQGALTLLSRDELQAVVAHEFSHILNQDSRINVRLTAILHGILVVSLLGDLLLRQRIRARNLKSAGGVAAIYLIGFILKMVGWMGLLAGRMIKGAISRQREFLADACAVQLTRHPTSLANALKKIGGYRWGAKIKHPHAEEASHFYFENGISSAHAWFATHPPIMDRIRVLEPNFDGNYPETARAEALPGVNTKIRQAHQPDAVAASPNAFTNQPKNIVLDQASVQCELARQHLAGYLSEEHAMSLIVAVLVPTSNSLEQLDYPLNLDTIRQIQQRLSQVPALKALTVLEFAAPFLRSHKKESLQNFLRMLKTMLFQQGSFTPFEFFAAILIRHQLDALLNPKASARTDFYSVNPLLEHVRFVLSYLASIGHPEDLAAEKAFQAGIQLVYRGHKGKIIPKGQCDIKILDQHLKPIAHAVLSIRHRILRACILTAEFDRTLTEQEEQILHAIACRLDCSLVGLQTDSM